nr:venom protein [Lampona murina]
MKYFAILILCFVTLALAKMEPENEEMFNSDNSGNAVDWPELRIDEEIKESCISEPGCIWLCTDEDCVCKCK